MFLIYSRVSTTEQAGRFKSSLAEQERVCRGVALTRGVQNTDIAVYQDPGASGTIPLVDRPAGARLLADVRPGDIVCASKLDRMFRDCLNAQQTYRDFKKQKVDLILFDLGADPITSGGVSKLIFTVISAVADMERERIAERMAVGKAAKRARGGWADGNCPFGFSVVGKGKEARLVPNETEQQILRVARDTHKAHASELHQYAIVRDAVHAIGGRTRRGGMFETEGVKRLIHRARVVL